MTEMGDVEKEPTKAAAAEKEPSGRHVIFRYITLITRTVCILITAAIWGLAIHMLHTKRATSVVSTWYLFALALFLTLMELIWIINKCASKFRNDGCCCACWQIIVWFDDWKKSILYVAAGIPAFTNSVISTETIIAGVLMFIAAVFYFAKSFRNCACVQRPKESKPTSSSPLIPTEQKPATDTPAPAPAPTDSPAPAPAPTPEPTPAVPPTPSEKL